MATRKVKIRYLWLAALLPVASGAATGCGGAANPPALTVPGAETTFLFDATAGATQRLHFSAVPDPFGGKGSVARGTAGAHGGQKLVFINDCGFFAMPADPVGRSVVIRMAVRGGRAVIVVLSGKDRGFSFAAALPDEGKWCDVELPLSAAGNRIAAGERIVDITIFGADPAPDAALYVHSAAVAVRSPVK